MSTGVIIVLIVIVAAVAVGAVAVTLRARGGLGGRDLKRRFGPEYDRVLKGHDGDTQAAERELAERVERHGALRERELDPRRREELTARWTAVQEHFVDAPQEAVAEADRLLAEVAADLGFPDAGHDEQLAALSVHHPDHLHGYRQVHHASNGGHADAGTEDLRAALIEARGLFEELVGAGAAPRRRPHIDRHDANHTTAKGG
ncbi:hypothetical protein ACIQOU_25900 [Streptomyces sp. NPDC091279]|uniref:hypothetical protein n=1 Tax=unclassified Streptomyces TaxID=2593676 RepID=UPI003820DBC8